jgi:hypothetical protein
MVLDTSGDLYRQGNMKRLPYLDKSLRAGTEPSDRALLPCGGIDC